MVGGAIFGALGFLFAPQISAALLNDEQRLRLPKFLDEEEKSPEATKQVCIPLNSVALLACMHPGQYMSTLPPQSKDPRMTPVVLVQGIDGTSDLCLTCSGSYGR